MVNPVVRLQRLWWLCLCVWCAAILTLAANTPAGAEIEAAHADIWKRFVSSHGLVLDYNTIDGAVELPTPEECANGKPNALSWWTPVENGAFFTGLYLDAAVRRWKLTGREEDRAQARRLAEGLLLCASVPDAPPGFIARFVLSDGHSHYAAGSDDQSGPWFYGLWRYLRSGAATSEEKARIGKKLVEVGEALRANHWYLPCDPIGGMKPGQNRGGFADSEFRSTTRLLFVTRILFEITSDASWQQAYEEALTETFKSTGKTRLEYLTGGIPSFYELLPDMRKNQLWLFLNAQGNLRELLDLEKRPEIREKYLATMRLNARTVASVVTATVPSTLEANPPKTDWRLLNTLWRVQSTSDEASKLGIEQLREWKNSGRFTEIAAVREPFCAAALVFLCPDRDAESALAAARFQKLIHQVSWAKLVSSYGIFAELAAYTWAETPGPVATEAELAVASPAAAAGSETAASAVAVTTGKLVVGGFRCTQAFPLTSVPVELQGKTIHTITRGPFDKPGASFHVKVSATGTVWLLVMNSGQQEPGAGWELTGLSTNWSAGGKTFTDKVYRRSVVAGAQIDVPIATGKQGAYYSLPHALITD